MKYLWRRRYHYGHLYLKDINKYKWMEKKKKTHKKYRSIYLVKCAFHWKWNNKAWRTINLYYVILLYVYYYISHWSLCSVWSNCIQYIYWTTQLVAIFVHPPLIAMTLIWKCTFTGSCYSVKTRKNEDLNSSPSQL